MSSDYGMLPVQIRTPSGKTGVFYVHTGAVIHPAVRSLVHHGVKEGVPAAEESKRTAQAPAKSKGSRSQEESRSQDEVKKKAEVKKKTEPKALPHEDLCKRMQSQLKSATVGISLHKFFRKFDKDRSGTLNSDELRRLVRIELRIPPATVSDKDVETLVAALDDDGSGTLSIDELVDFIEKGTATFFTGMDGEDLLAEDPKVEDQSSTHPAETSVTDSDLSVGDIVYCNGDLASIVTIEGIHGETAYVVRIAQTGEKVACKRHHMQLALATLQGALPDQQAYGASYIHMGEVEPSVQYMNLGDESTYADATQSQPAAHVPNHALAAAAEALDKAEVEFLMGGKTGSLSRRDQQSSSWTASRDQYPGWSRNYALQAAGEALGIVHEAVPELYESQSVGVDVHENLAQQGSVFASHRMPLTDHTGQSHFDSVPQSLGHEGYGTAAVSSMPLAYVPVLPYPPQRPPGMYRADAPPHDRNPMAEPLMSRQPIMQEGVWSGQQSAQKATSQLQSQASASFAEVREEALESLCQPPSLSSVEKGIEHDAAGFIGVDNVGARPVGDDALEFLAAQEMYRDEIEDVTASGTSTSHAVSSKASPQQTKMSTQAPAFRKAKTRELLASEGADNLKPSRPQMPKNPIAPPSPGKHRGRHTSKSAVMNRDSLVESVLSEPLPIGLTSPADRATKDDSASKRSLKASFLPGVGSESMVSTHSRQRGIHGSLKSRSPKQTGGGILSKPEASLLPNLSGRAQAVGGPRERAMAIYKAQSSTYSKFRQSWKGQASGIF